MDRKQAAREAGHDYYLVWSEEIREQLLEIYPGVRSDHVIVTGTPLAGPSALLTSMIGHSAGHQRGVDGESGAGDVRQVGSLLGRALARAEEGRARPWHSWQCRTRP
ncbi:MAG: hypothetical protein HYV07_09350 [Deltaproteobacteria bacterium]|nr:hypothetical protein [Deltaproteobacteria bacterium]